MSVPEPLNPQAAPNVAALLAATRRPASLTQASQTINLAIGEPDLAPPQSVIEALSQALTSGHTHYVDQSGDPELRDAISAHEAMRTGLDLHRENVQVTVGGTSAIASTILGLVGPGDRVVVPDPTYSLYADAIRLAGGTVVPVATKPDHHLDLEALARVLPGARMFAYCSPVNPTGAVYTRAELENLGMLLAGTDTIVLDDAAYSTMVFAPSVYTSALEVPSLAPRTVQCQTFSKAYAMTGFRVGYITGAADVVATVGAVHRTFVGSVNAAVQRSALAALETGDEFTEAASVDYASRLALAHELLCDIPELEAHRAEGSFYLFARILTGHSSDDTVRHLYDRGVKVRSGAEFGSGGEGYVRISCSVANAVLIEGLEQMKVAMAELTKERSA